MHHQPTDKRAPLLASVMLGVALLMVFGAAWGQPTTFSEAPMLAARVAAGELPPVHERLPANPLVVVPYERIGQYGGAWRTVLLGAGDANHIRRTVGYEGLLRFTPTWDGVIPNVAESYEVNEDATEFTFRLRQGMRWSDGHPFTAADIMFWYEDVVTNVELTPAVPGWFTTGPERTPGTVEKIDDYTVVVRFAEPNGLFLINLAHTGNGWLLTAHPRHYLEQFHIRYNPEGIDELVAAEGVATWVELFQAKGGLEARWQNTELPNLNPWVLTAPYDGTTTRVVAERNPFYWKVDPEGNQLPYLDRVIYDIFESAEVLLLRTLAGEIDMISRHINTVANMPVLFDNMERGNYGFFEITPANMNMMIIALNLTHQDPVKREIFQNRDFRVGLSHAIDRQEIIDLVFVGQGAPHQASPRPESPLFHERLATQYLEYDPGLANEILDRHFPARDGEGFRLGPDGRRISFVVEVIPALQPFWVDMLELIQGYWRAVGIDIQIGTMDRSLFYTRKDANLHDANVWMGDGGMIDAIIDPRWYFPSNGESNFAPAWAKWFNPAVFPGTTAEEPPAATQRQMDLYRKLVASPPEQQGELMRQILDIAAEEFYVIGISLPTPGFGIVKNTFHNVPASMPGAWIYPTPAPTNPEQFFIEAGH